MIGESGEGAAPEEEAASLAEAALAAEADSGAEAAGDADGKRIEVLASEYERLQLAHARAIADYQNLRRRSAEDRAEQSRLLMKTLVLNYLPVLDDLNRALDSVGAHDDLTGHQWVEGVRMVQRKFSGLLQASGVDEIAPDVGDPFDPSMHEAIANQPGPLNEVIGVVQIGYTIDRTVIRAATVIVGDGGGDGESAGPGAASDDDGEATTTSSD